MALTAIMFCQSIKRRSSESIHIALVTGHHEFNKMATGFPSANAKYNIFRYKNFPSSERSC